METITVIIETPKGSTEKYDYDPDYKLFRLKKMLPAGMVFPYDFGFIPKTRGEDGDPLDVLVISEFQSFPGCLVNCRLIGAILAEQKDKKSKVRNDRFVAIPALSDMFKDIVSIEELPKSKLKELQEFFVDYNKIEGRKFIPKGLAKPKAAMALIRKSKSV